MQVLIRCRVADGVLKPMDHVGAEVLATWPHAVAFVELQDEKRARTRQQERYWFGVVVPAIGQCWQHERGWAAAPAKEVVHGALVQAVFGTVDTPLGPQRISSTSLTTEQYSELIDWAREYARERYKAHIPEAGEMGEA